MAGIVKTVLRLGVIGGLITGGAVLVAGPQRVAALTQQLHHKIVSVIDSGIQDPIAMRAQLRDLEAQYPKRIAEVRSSLAELGEQARQIEREKSISERVVELARSDQGTLQTLLTRAQDAQSGAGGYSIVKVQFNHSRMNLDEAYRRANNISDTVQTYAARVADYQTDLDNLQTDEQSLQTLLAKLETEHADFQSQLSHLERQIDAVARKERMISMLADRRKRMDELSRYHVASMDQFKSVLAKKTAELDARLAGLTSRSGQESYEDAARYQVDREASANSAAQRLSNERFAPVTPQVIEIAPAPDTDDGSQVASSAPLAGSSH